MSSSAASLPRVLAAAFAIACACTLLLFVAPLAAAAEETVPPQRSALTDDNTGGVGIEKNGSRLTVLLGEDLADVERVRVFVYPDASDAEAEAVDVGVQEVATGSFGIDVSLMPAGEVLVVLLGQQDGALLGWAATDLEESESHAPRPGASDEAAQGDTEAADTVPVWPWVVGGVVLLAAAGVAALLVWRRRSDSSGAGGRTESTPSADESAPSATGPTLPEGERIASENERIPPGNEAVAGQDKSVERSDDGGT